ncbi:MAG TPA: GTP-binding protein [Saprospiraceae bacterium]|nr:GTP-binding protein [Saprospiraceae bacterium]
MTSKKIILAGSFGVGKTSLFSRFLYNTFSEKYLTTIGVKVDKKVVDIDGRKLTMIIWDVAGEVSQTKVPINYLLGSSGIIYVFDLSRPITYTNMEEDIEYLNKTLPGALIKIVGNKKDLLSQEELTNTQKNIPLQSDIFTSAKTGENVEELFHNIGKALID